MYYSLLLWDILIYLIHTFHEEGAVMTYDCVTARNLTLDT
jgi:hypothetical protein